MPGSCLGGDRSTLHDNEEHSLGIRLHSLFSTPFDPPLLKSYELIARGMGTPPDPGPPQAHGPEEVLNLLSSPNPLGPPFLKGDAREFRRIEGHPQTPGSLPLHRHSAAL